MEKHITEVMQGQPYHIKLIKGQRDAYGWEIVMYGADMDAIIWELKEIHDKMMDGALAEYIAERVSVASALPGPTPGGENSHGDSDKRRDGQSSVGRCRVFECALGRVGGGGRV